MAKKARTPAIAFINKMDKPNADWRKAVNTLRDKLKVQPVLVQIPLLEDNGEFVGMLDVIRQQKITNGGKHGEELRIEAFASLPTHHQEALRDAKHELIEVLSGRDDDFATAWIMALDKADGDEVAAEALLGPAELIPPLRRAVLKGLASVDAVGGAHNHLDGLPSLLPVLFGAARRNLGVQPLMDAVVDYLPSPLDRPALDGFTATGDLVPVPSPLAPINVGMAFKVMFFPDPKTQKPRALVFTRMYSGSVTKGQRLQNKRTGDVITVEKLYVMQGNTLAEVDSLQSGAIGAFFSDKMATGDTVFAERGSLAHRKAVGGIAEDATAAFHSFEPITPPTPVISHAIEPQSVHEMAELKRCLSCLAIEDPTFTNSENDHGQLVVSAMGELHVEVMVSRLRRHFQVRCELAKAIIEYAESVAEEQVVHDVILHAPGAGGVPVAKLSVAIRPNLQQDELVPSDLVADPAVAAVVTSILPSAEESYKDSVALKFAAAQKMSDDDRKLPREQLLAKVRNQATDRAAKLELRAMRIGLGQAAPSIAKMGKLRLKVKGLEFAIVHAEKIGDELSADDYAKAFVKVLSDTIAHTTNPTVMEPVMDMTVTLSEDQHTQAVFSLLNDRLASYIAVDEEEAGAGTVIKAVVPMRTITRFSGDLRKATKGNAHFWTTLRCYKLVSNDDLRGRILKSLGHSA
jgi:elongation factor G